MLKLISIPIFIGLPFFALCQIWQIGITTAYTKSELIVPIQRIDRFNSVNEWHWGVSATRQFGDNYSINFVLSFMDTIF